MLSPLTDRTYRHLYAAQLLSLLGTGLATVALGLLAFELAGADAGAVLGTALAIKMVAYVSVAPVAGAFTHLVPRRTLLVALDLMRALVAVALPFVTEIWQVYVLIAILQCGSAAFTPTFQATIPDVLPDEAEYTKALSLSRLAYDTEALVSPLLAAALLSVIGFHWLFAGTVLGFIASAALVITVLLPSPKPAIEEEGAWRRVTRGARIYLATPRLRGLLAFNLAVAAAGAMVIVNTVVVVRGGLGLTDREVAFTFASYGAGSIVAALILPRLLMHAPDRAAMLMGATLLILGMAVGPWAAGHWAILLPLWFVLGIGNGLVLTPSGRLLRRSAHPGDRPALFAAQFALSHACWLLTYPLAGWLGAGPGIPVAFAALALLALVGTSGAAWLWPADDPEEVEHEHVAAGEDDPHLRDAGDVVLLGNGRYRHRHALIVDDRHPRWPSRLKDTA
jgi:MFS family permease